MPYTIQHLPKEQWQGFALPIGYTTQEYYDVAIGREEAGFTVTILKKAFQDPVSHTPQEYDFPDKLYAEHWQGACAWGILEEGKLLAAIETCPEEWSNRLRITELWVDPSCQKQGLGHALMEVAKEQAAIEHRRAILLETQSCNVNAIGFYLHEGFTFIGMDACCYSNTDLERKEVRLELGWFPPRKAKEALRDVMIRPEQPEDYHGAEGMIRQAFWNTFQKGCDEHYLVHRLRETAEYLPELSRLAVKGGEVIGAIWYSRAFVEEGDKRQEVLTFGPLGVKREWRGCGLGEKLVRETMRLAAEAGFPGIIILGAPAYYGRMGFHPCDRFGITTKEGRNFPEFMGIELIPGGFRHIHGRFHALPLFENPPPQEVEAFDTAFPPLEKQYFPTQW